MKIAGWVIAAVGLALGLAAFGSRPLPPWWAFAGCAGVFLVGLCLALGSQLVVLVRRVAYGIREIRSAVKGEPEPPPPAPDLMQTMRQPMKAVPKPEEKP